LGQYGQFQSLTGTDEANMPEWWKPADHAATRGINRATEQPSSAWAASEKVAKTLYFEQSLPQWPRYKNVVMNAAKLVAEQVPQCAEVTHAGLDVSCLDAKGLPKCSPTHAKVAVECRIADAWKSHKWYATNPNDIWYVENGEIVGEFAKGVKSVEEAKAYIPTASEQCRQWIKDHTTHPSTVNFDLGEEITNFGGSIVVHKGFDAKNSFGLELHYVAVCSYYPADGKFEAF